MKFPLMSANIKNVFLLIGSIVLGKGIVLLCTPFITRLYDPYLFGILALILSFSRILFVIFSMRYELKFLNVDQEERFSVLQFLNTHVYTLFLLSILVCSLITLGLDKPMYYLMVPFFALVIAMNNIHRFYNVASKNFNKIAVSEVIKGLGQGLIPLLAYFSSLFVPIGLVVSELSGWAGSVFSLSGVKRLTATQKFNTYLSNLKKAYREMLLTGSSKLLNVSTDEIIPIGIGFLFNNELLGLYFVAKKIMAVPISLITRSIGDVTNNAVSEIFLKSGANKAKNYLFKQFRLLVLAGLVFGVGVYFLIDFLIDIFLDEKYEKVSQIIKLSLVYYCGMLMVQPLSNYFNIIGKYKVSLIWDIIRFSLVITSFVVGWLMDLGFDKFILLLSICLFTGYLVFVFLLKFYKIKDDRTRV